MSWEGSSEIYRWDQKGEIYLWKYLQNEKNFPGLNVSFDSAGYASFLALLRLFHNQMQGITRTVKATPPSKAILARPNNGMDVLAYKALKIFVSGSENEVVEFGSEAILLRVSQESLAELLSSVESLKQEEAYMYINRCRLAFW